MASHWAGNYRTDDDIAMAHKSVNENAWIGSSIGEYDPEVEAEIAAYDARHKRTLEHDAQQKKVREKQEIVRRVLAVLENKKFKTMTAINPRNYALVAEITKEIWQI